MPAETNDSDQTGIMTPIADINVLGRGASTSAIESHYSLRKPSHDTTVVLSRTGVASVDEE